MDNYSRNQMIGIGISFLVLPVFAVAARIWAKILCRKGIRLDDYLIIIALVSILVEPPYSLILTKIRRSRSHVASHNL